MYLQNLIMQLSYLSPGIRYGQSAPLLPQEWRWSPLFPVPLVHQQLSGPAALCPAALQAAVPGGGGEGCETG